MSSDSHFFPVGALIMLLMMVLYALLGVTIEKYHFPVGHESGIAIMVGGILSYLLWTNDYNDLN